MWLLSAVLLFSCQQSSSQQAGNAPVALQPIAFQKTLLASATKQVLDVRTPDEYNSGHLSGATNINFYDSDFARQIARLDKKTPVFVYCKAGGRSAKAAEALQAAGFSAIYDLAGGMMAWANEQMPVASSEAAPHKDSFTAPDLAKVLAEHEAVLIDFYAPWCIPCRKMEPTLARLAQEYAGKVHILRVNVDDAAALVREMQVTDIPVLIRYTKGNAIKTVKGLQSEAQLRELLAL